MPAYSTQATLYNLINRLHIASLYPSIFKQGQTSLKEITPLVVKNIKDSELDNVYLKTIVDFSNNFDPQKLQNLLFPKVQKYIGEQKLMSLVISCQKYVRSVLLRFYENNWSRNYYLRN